MHNISRSKPKHAIDEGNDSASILTVGMLQNLLTFGILDDDPTS